MPITRMRVRGGNRTQALRRQIYSDRNAATLARLQRQEQLGHQREQAAQPLSIGNLLDQTNPAINYTNDSWQESTSWDQAGAESEWVTFGEDVPDSIDLAMASYKERYRQQAREYNWELLICPLQGEYMKLKVKTNNWAGPNSYDSFASCSPACSKRYS
ncbi:hypothetical protein PtA15_15A61 [Puccinia triticina]|nr:uncharacterized protein PtA15_15A61 [Puccinia triticina]WAQ91671.1 hypothetical protein PtA15_15A61 [Puccinia triticina]